MEILIIAIIIGVIPAAIASGKGRSFIGWWLYGALLFIVALPHAIVTKPNQATLDRRMLKNGYKQCPHCDEWIRPDARVCPKCGRDVIEISPEPVVAVLQASTLTPQDDIPLAIKKLKSMLDDGLITQEEHDSKKAELLARM